MGVLSTKKKNYNIYINTNQEISNTILSVIYNYDNQT